MIYQWNSSRSFHHHSKLPVRNQRISPTDNKTHCLYRVLLKNSKKMTYILKHTQGMCMCGAFWQRSEFLRSSTKGPFILGQIRGQFIEINSAYLNAPSAFKKRFPLSDIVLYLIARIFLKAGYRHPLAHWLPLRPPGHLCSHAPLPTPLALCFPGCPSCLLTPYLLFNIPSFTHLPPQLLTCPPLSHLFLHPPPSPIDPYFPFHPSFPPFLFSAPPPGGGPPEWG